MRKVEDIIDMASSGDSGYEQFNRLMRKYELDKKVYVAYDHIIKMPITRHELQKDGYAQLAICLCLQAVKHNDVRFYNTALKIGDTIDMGMPEINFAKRYE
ncbi:hypothetical protein NC796_17905 [Aliifodinibius sp. S!AR15-10]|uniref:hypothetical protein n=1 Tax=Aliifodinibius sp. S!AR15-10 TaxID=2950437 RepID=UPI002862B737|nr:hypothetical protein [Aliifodinibius sp. S!AR15-10]MDR8393036.1 hypothetical protein [Aliifodinibius sp. S!AR15-10]